LLVFLVSCSRSPKAISSLETEKRAKQDILKIEEIKKTISLGKKMLK